MNKVVVVVVVVVVVFTKMDTFDFILLLYDKGLINDNDLLLLCRSYIF